ncbi:MAG TPA: biotin transporter BioY [Clostridiaceae bacterium]|nr:biotin transporter BioY [Clostridiaceae bacterium]
MILTAIFSSLTIVFAQISIKLPFSPVPITMQTLAVCLAAAVLGKKYGAISQVVYVLMGVIGLPVFSGFNSGLGALIGPTGGYLVSFPLTAFVVGYILEKNNRKGRLLMFFAMLAGLAVCYTFGTLWLGLSLNLSFAKALVAGMGWYLPLDVIKIFFASFLAYNVRETLIKSGFLNGANSLEKKMQTN